MTHARHVQEACLRLAPPSQRPRRCSMADKLWVFFPATGQKFPIRFMMTSDLYEVELPAGTYGGPLLEDLRQELKRDFNDVRITK